MCYCYSTVLIKWQYSIWQELEPESEPKPKLWTKVEPESEPKINNFGSATLLLSMQTEDILILLEILF